MNSPSALAAQPMIELDDTDQAMSALKRALSLAEPEGYVRTFVDKGQPMANLLRRLRRVLAFYGAEPVFLFCSATIGNPAELAGQLLKSQYVDACRRDVRAKPVYGEAEQREEDLALQLRDLEEILGSLQRLSAFVRHVSRSVPRFRRPLRSSRAPLR